MLCGRRYRRLAKTSPVRAFVPASRERRKKKKKKREEEEEEEREEEEGEGEGAECAMVFTGGAYRRYRGVFSQARAPRTKNAASGALVSGRRRLLRSPRPVRLPCPGRAGRASGRDRGHGLRRWRPARAPCGPPPWRCRRQRECPG